MLCIRWLSSLIPFIWSVAILIGTLTTADSAQQLNDVLSLCVGLWAVKVAGRQTHSRIYTYGVRHTMSISSAREWMLTQVVATCGDSGCPHQRGIPRRAVSFNLSRSYSTLCRTPRSLSAPTRTDRRLLRLIIKHYWAASIPRPRPFAWRLRPLACAR